MQFLIIASDIQPFEGPHIKAPDVLDLMMKHQCWEFPAAAPHLSKLTPGSRLVFYLGGNHARYLAGEAVIDGEFQEIKKNSPVTFDRATVPFFHWRLPLRDLRRYEGKSAGLDTLMKLSFAKEKVTRPYIGLLLRVGLRPLTEEDLEVIRKDAGLVAR